MPTETDEKMSLPVFDFFHSQGAWAFKVFAVMDAECGDWQRIVNANGLSTSRPYLLGSYQIPLLYLVVYMFE